MNMTNAEMLRILLSARRLPARLHTQAAALVLGFQEHDIPILIRAKLLKPLGNPAANAVKYFAAVDVEECARDAAWLNKATVTISRHWSLKNMKRQPSAELPET